MSDQFAVDRLFRVTGKVDITLRGITRTYYLRTITGAGEEARRDYAMDKAVAMRKALQDPESPDHEKYLGNFDKAGVDDLRRALTIFKRNEFAREAIQNIHLEDEPEPSDDPDLAEITDIEIEKQKIFDDLVARRQKYLDESLAEWETEADGLDVEDLRVEAIRLQTENVLAGIFNEAADHASLFWGVFEDKKYTRKLYSSPDEVAESDPELIAQLKAKYNEIDSFSSSLESLKN